MKNSTKFTYTCAQQLTKAATSNAGCSWQHLIHKVRDSSGRGQAGAEQGGVVLGLFQGDLQTSPTPPPTPTCGRPALSLAMCCVYWGQRSSSALPAALLNSACVWAGRRSTGKINLMSWSASALNIALSSRPVVCVRVYVCMCARHAVARN